MNAPLDAGQRASLEAALKSVTLDDKYTGTRPRVHERHPGPRAPADAAAGTRSRRRSQYRRLHLRLSWFAARRPRSVALESQAALPPTRSSSSPAQRRSRRHRRVPQQVNLYPARSTTACSACGTAAGRRPHGRRIQARELGRLVAAWRRAGARRRRPRGEIVDARAPVRTHLQGLRAAGAVPVQRAGISRFRPARLGDEPLLGPVGRAQVRDGRRRIVGIGRHRPASHRDRAADRLHPAGRRAEHPLARSAARAGSAAARLQVVCGARLRAREQARPHRDRFAERALRDHDRRQGVPGRAPGADRPRPRRRNLRADRHPALQGRLRVAARSAGRAGVRARPTKSSSWRKSARSSNTRSRKSCTGPTASGRACSASSTRRTAPAANGRCRWATGCCPRTTSCRPRSSRRRSRRASRSSSCRPTCVRASPRASP